MIKSSKSQDGRTRELSAVEVEAVSGGLNPQPLPPRWSFPAWNVRAFNVLKIASFNFSPGDLTLLNHTRPATRLCHVGVWRRIDLEVRA